MRAPTVVEQVDSPAKRPKRKNNNKEELELTETREKRPILSNKRQMMRIRAIIEVETKNLGFVTEVGQEQQEDILRV